jgi:hypothetical protein
MATAGSAQLSDTGSDSRDLVGLIDRAAIICREGDGASVEGVTIVGTKQRPKGCILEQDVKPGACHTPSK